MTAEREGDRWKEAWGSGARSGISTLPGETTETDEKLVYVFGMLLLFFFTLFYPGKARSRRSTNGKNGKNVSELVRHFLFCHLI